MSEQAGARRDGAQRAALILLVIGAMAVIGYLLVPPTNTPWSEPGDEPGDGGPRPPRPATIGSTGPVPAPTARPSPDELRLEVREMRLRELRRRIEDAEERGASEEIAALQAELASLEQGERAAPIIEVPEP